MDRKVNGKKQKDGGDMENKSIENNARLKVAEIMAEPEIAALAGKIYEYDNVTFVHCQNVAYLTAQFCYLFGLNSDYSREIITGALIHDIGKIKIPKEITNKKGSLTSEEYRIVKTHTLEGLNILRDSDTSDTVKDIVLCHHERVDGSGYPFGLSGDSVKLHTKIVSIVDCYDAMTSKRSYGIVYPAKEAIKVLYREDKGIEINLLKILEKCEDK